MSTIYTIGHSNHSWSRWLELLATHEIRLVADVRSIPYSRFSPQFVRRQLEPALRQAGREYLFLGRELGGIPEDEAYYDDDGHVLYGRLAARRDFGAAIERLLTSCRTRRVALMCGEENPEHCHRRLLVSKALLDRGVEVCHLRGDGSAQPEETLGRPPAGLFDDPLPWRSHRPVRRR